MTKKSGRPPRAKTVRAKTRRIRPRLGSEHFLRGGAGVHTNAKTYQRRSKHPKPISGDE